MLQIVLCCFALVAAKHTLIHPTAIDVLCRLLSESSQYTNGYSAGTSAKAEPKTVDGVWREICSNVDGNVIVQTARNIAKDVKGFRAVARNISSQVFYDTPEVAAAKVAHAAAYNKAAYVAAVSPDVGEAVVCPPSVYP
jgi:hypothetical protein